MSFRWGSVIMYSTNKCSNPSWLVGGAVQFPGVRDTQFACLPALLVSLQFPRPWCPWSSTVRSCLLKTKCIPASCAPMWPAKRGTWKDTFASIRASTLSSATCALLTLLRAAISWLTCAPTPESDPFHVYTAVHPFRWEGISFATCAATQECVPFPVWTAMHPLHGNTTSFATCPVVVQTRSTEGERRGGFLWRGISVTGLSWTEAILKRVLLGRQKSLKDKAEKTDRMQH